jgi:hypothetical protein
MKESGPATDWTEIDRFDGGVGWIAYPEETMQRASHALTDGDDVWLVDPVDAEGIDDLFAEYGDVAGVVILLDRHKRDAAAIARRHGVSVWIPAFMDGVAEDIDAPVERFRHDLADTGFAAHTIIDNSLWAEAVLYDDDGGVLVVPEAVGTTPYFRTRAEPLGVHPMLRMTPPRKLGRLEPDRILVGHGAGVHEDATRKLRDAVDGARRRTPQLVYKNVKNLVLG